MAVKTKEQIKTDAETLLADNITGDISPQDVRDRIIDIADSLSFSATMANVAFTGQYNDLLSKPLLANVALSGSYTDLTNIPALANVALSASYNDLVDKPNFANVALSGSYNDLKDVPPFGSAAFSSTSAFATASQGLKADTAVQPTITISAGTGLEGGGSLASNKTISLSSASIASLSKADTAVQPNELATVATTGDYDDLSNKPTLGTAAATDSSNYATAAQAVPGGGTTGQVLTKASDANNDVAWSNIDAYSSNGGVINDPTDEVVQGAIVHVALKAGDGGKGIVVSGRSTDGTGDEDDAHGLLIALAHNQSSSNRQLFFGNSETLFGIRVISNSLDGYNLGTAARVVLNLGTDTHGVNFPGFSTASKGFQVKEFLRLPFLTTAQRDALVGVAAGYFIYNADVEDLQFYNGVDWLSVASIGSGQTWQNVTASRSTGTNYVNNTGRPIAMSLTLGSSGTLYYVDVLIDGQTVVPWAGQQQRAQLYIEVPPGATYRVNASLAGINQWWELRA